MVEWICRLCNMAFESGVVPEEWRSPVTVSLYNGKEKRNECNNYRGISLLSIVGKIYAGILVDRVHRGLGVLEKGWDVDQIFTLKHKRKCRVE